MAKNDGGSAFPQIETDADRVHPDSDEKYSHVYSFGGMSLRDWFAGMVAMGNRARGTVYHSWEDLAKDAYEAADSMLAERKK